MERTLLVGMLCAAMASATACSGDGSTSETFDSFDALREAAEEAPGFCCTDVIAAETMGEEILDDFKSRFNGLQDFGACITDRETMSLIVFEDAGALDYFVDSSLWVDFKRMYEPVADGQTFTGVAGENWIITDFRGKASFLDQLGAEQVDSQPAVGDSQK